MVRVGGIVSIVWLEMSNLMKEAPSVKKQSYDLQKRGSERCPFEIFLPNQIQLATVLA